MTSACRSCGGADVESFLDLGPMPLSDALRHPDRLREAEPRYPLEVAFCAGCSLVQILHSVDPEVLFCRDYPYFSSFSDHLLRHSRDSVRDLCAARGLGPQSLVIELASNDGYLLQYFAERGVPVLGIDPAAGPAAAARAKGIPTLGAFFTRELAERLRDEGRRADVLVANNVLAHVPDPNAFVAGIARVLQPGGTASIEAPYVKDLIDGCQFDTIYHEHVCYLSVTSMQALLTRNGLFLNKIVHLPIHGGSLRYLCGPTEEPDGSVEAFWAMEARVGLDTFAYYADFAGRVARLKDELADLLRRLRSEGKRIAAYGAAAKGAILLNYLGIDETLIDFVVDKNTHKQGLYMPGVALPIRPPQALLEQQPDFVLLLPWNLEAEIVAQEREYLARGGRFIVPVPRPRIVTA